VLVLVGIGIGIAFGIEIAIDEHSDSDVDTDADPVSDISSLLFIFGIGFSAFKVVSALPRPIPCQEVIFLAGIEYKFQYHNVLGLSGRLFMPGTHRTDSRTGLSSVSKGASK
jgi:hypothetical protein